MAIEETFTQTSVMNAASNKEFTISSAATTGFDFLRTSDVKVYLTPSGGTKTLQTVTTHYTLDKATKKITFVSKPDEDAVITAERVTAVSEPINTFQAGSAVTASALNDSLNQLRFNIQEYGTLTNSGSLSSSDKGDITVSNSGNTWTIDNGVVTSAKLATNIDMAGTLDVTGNTVFDNNVNIKGDNKTFTIEKADGTDKFTVASQTGNTTVAGTLGVTGATTLTGALDANGGASIDNIQIGVTGDNEIDTSSGNLTIDSAGGTTTIDDILTVTGTVNINTGIRPDTDEGAYIGQVALPFSEAFVGEIKIASTDDNTIDTVSGNLELDSATGTTVIDDNCNINGTLAVNGKATVTGGPICLGDGSEKTISNGSITVTTSYHRVDPEGDVNDDHLDKIECAAYTTGQLLVLRTVHDDRNIIIRHNQHAGQNYNIMCDADFTLNDNEDTVTFMWDAEWHRIAGKKDND